jgi:hypothetical protein
MNVLEAIEIMKLNKQMRRKIWSAQTRVELVLGTTDYAKVTTAKIDGIPVGLFNGGTSEITQAPYFVAKTNDSEIIGYEFKSIDVLATDWEEYTG